MQRVSVLVLVSLAAFTACGGSTSETAPPQTASPAPAAPPPAGAGEAAGAPAARDDTSATSELARFACAPPLKRVERKVLPRKYLGDDEQLSRWRVGCESSRGTLEGPALELDRDRRHVLARGEYRADKKQALWRWTLPDGTPVRDVDYDEGKPHGRWIEWASAGKQLFEQHMTKGVLDGVRTTFHPNGKPLERMQWRLGVLEGAWERFDEHGALAERVELEKGTIRPQPSRVAEGWWKRGSTACPPGMVLDGSPAPAGLGVMCMDPKDHNGNGPFTQWDRLGNRREGVAVAGKIEGLVTEWDKGGWLMSQSVFREGTAAGRHLSWDDVKALREIVLGMSGTDAMFSWKARPFLVAELRDGHRVVEIELSDTGRYLCANRYVGDKVVSTDCEAPAPY